MNTGRAIIGDDQVDHHLHAVRCHQVEPGARQRSEHHQADPCLERAAVQPDGTKHASL